MTEPTIRVIAERTYGIPQELLPDRPRDIRRMDVPEHMAERIAGWFEASGWKVTTEKIG